MALKYQKRGWHLTFQELINPWPSNLTVLNLLETISRSNWKFGMLVFWKRGKLGKKGNQQQTQTTYGINNGTWSWITLVGGRCFQRWTIPVPPMCSKSSINPPLLISPPFWERKLISPSPCHLPSYSSQQNWEMTDCIDLTQLECYVWTDLAWLIHMLEVQILFYFYFILFFIIGCMTSQLHTLDLFLFPFKVFMKNWYHILNKLKPLPSLNVLTINRLRLEA